MLDRDRPRVRGGPGPGWLRVFAGVRRDADGEALRSETSDRLEPLIIDVTDGETIAAAAERVREATGGRLAGLINNAGITVGGPVEAIPLEDFRRQLEVNVTGQVAVTQAFLGMIRAARGRIVFISSIGGRGGLQFLSPYNASKAALAAIGDSLRQEMKPFGVDVSIVEPGSIATEIWAKGDDQAQRLSDALDPGVLALYGERIDRMRALAAKTGAAGLPAEAVAEVVQHALTAPRPRARYVVGRDAKVQAVARRVLPHRALDRLVEREIDRAS
ncbi:MAG TPA: SDR family NAD(P)-dependent oxidoreductase [Solirubrobacterales bacterium]|nr:SDR family NAD(P)-dependent oxidoreductase [Solirubrobacterales bacterium]